MTLLEVTAQGVRESAAGLEPALARLAERRNLLGRQPVDGMLDLLDALSARLLKDPRTQSIEGISFLAGWLRRDNQRRLLELSLHGNPAYLDGFVACGGGYLAAKPQGLVAMWMAGNVGTLPFFSIVPALLAKNNCLVKLSRGEVETTQRILAVLAETTAGNCRGTELLDALEVVVYDHAERAYGEAMSLAADARVVWGGAAAVQGVTSLPRREHCVDVIFGPKYSIGLLGKALLEGEQAALEAAVAGLVRDVAFSDQRACSSPQTIFVERSERTSLADVGQMFARQLEKLPAKREQDAYTTARIVATRAAWALAEARDVIASLDGPNWTVCLDEELSLKEAVQSRTLFLTKVATWRQVLPLLSAKVQTVGAALGDVEETLAFADAATTAGVARCVRPGLMNVQESPWDGRLLVHDLVRWVTCKP